MLERCQWVPSGEGSLHRIQSEEFAAGTENAAGGLFTIIDRGTTINRGTIQERGTI